MNSTEWIPAAIAQKSPNLTLPLIYSVPIVLDPDPLRLDTRQFMRTDLTDAERN